MHGCLPEWAPGTQHGTSCAARYPTTLCAGSRTPQQRTSHPPTLPAHTAYNIQQSDLTNGEISTSTMTTRANTPAAGGTSAHLPGRHMQPAIRVPHESQACCCLHSTWCNDNCRCCAVCRPRPSAKTKSSCVAANMHGKNREACNDMCLLPQQPMGRCLADDDYL